jgi:NADPH:quinone reductase-like Zn-dependent oxidoreductase
MKRDACQVLDCATIFNLEALAVKVFALDEFGKPGSVQDLLVPDPAEGDVRVKVAAAAINPMDVFVTKGFLKDRAPHEFPLVPGMDLSGTVDAVGPGVNGFKIGDPVFGVVGKATYGRGSVGEYVIASAGSIAKRPAGIGAIEAAAFPLAGVSAVQAVEAVDPKPGQTVLVVGAAGGIGSFAVQVLKSNGAHVIAVAGPANAEYVKKLGADEVIDYTSQDVVAAVKAKHSAVDAIVDTVSTAEGLAPLTVLVRQGGRVSSMRGAANAEELAKRNITGTNVRTSTTTESLNQLARLVEAGKVKAPHISTYPLERAGDAIDKSASGHARGKLVVTV